MRIGQRLRQIREERGLTIRALAQKSGLNEGTISNYEHDRYSPSSEAIRVLAAALEVSAGRLLEEGQEQKTNEFMHAGHEDPRMLIPEPIAMMFGALSSEARRRVQQYIFQLWQEQISGATSSPSERNDPMA